MPLAEQRADTRHVVRKIAERIVLETTLLPIDEGNAGCARNHVPRCEIAVDDEAAVHRGQRARGGACVLDVGGVVPGSALHDVGDEGIATVVRAVPTQYGNL